MPRAIAYPSQLDPGLRGGAVGGRLWKDDMGLIRVSPSPSGEGLGWGLSNENPLAEAPHPHPLP